MPLKSRGTHKMQRNLTRGGAILSEKPPGALHPNRIARKHCSQRICSRPIDHTVHEMVSHWIGKYIEYLFEDILRGSEMRGAGCL